MKITAIAVLSLALFGLASAQNDNDILNFALNYKCLEAAFFSCAAYGINLTDAYLGNGGPVSGCQKAALKGPAFYTAAEIAKEDLEHIRFLRLNLGNDSIACPKIDIGPAFAQIVELAYNDSTITPEFSPYFDVYNFYAGAFIFKDLGVTALKGSVRGIQNKGILNALMSLLATESYHAGIVRAQLSENSFIPMQQANTNLGNFAQVISSLRSTLSGAVNDAGVISADGSAQLIPADTDGLVFSRTPQQVLQIVYGSGSAAKPGLFFPDGVNGYFSPLNLING